MSLPPFELQRIEPLIVRGAVNDVDQLAAMQEYGYQALKANEWSRAFVNEHEYLHIRMSPDRLANSTDARVRIEQKIDEAGDTVADFIASHPELAVNDYSTVGFYFYFGKNRLLMQPWNRNARPTDTIHLTGEGGVQTSATDPRVLSTGQTWVNHQTNPGDIFLPGTTWYRGFGLGNPVDPKISAYFY